jgi:hypothetical protein
VLVNDFTSLAICQVRVLFGGSWQVVLYPANTVFANTRCWLTLMSPRSAPGVVRSGRMRAVPGLARRTRNAVHRLPGALQPSQARRSTARVLGKGSAGFRCQMSHIAGMRTVPDVGTDWAGVRFGLFKQLSRHTLNIGGRDFTVACPLGANRLR